MKQFLLIHQHVGTELRAFSEQSEGFQKAISKRLSCIVQQQDLVFTLPGDRMFQSTGICRERQRPPIMRAYGGAKIGMAQALRSIAGDAINTWLVDVDSESGPDCTDG